MESFERTTTVLPASDQAVQQAAEALRASRLVVFPTETVYGLGADAENPAAVRAMYAAKGRPVNHPVILHLAEGMPLEAFAAEVPPAARQLADAFWPGPLTLILKRHERVSELVAGGLATVGLRVPGHPVAQQLLRAVGRPVAAPSANRFGRVSATRVEHVIDELAGRVDLILDGGPCAVGVESTIVDLTSAVPAILRPGAVTAEQISAVLNVPVGGASSSAPRVSGSLPSHYAPRARVEIVPADAILRRAAGLAASGERVAVLSSLPPSALDSSCLLLEIPATHAEFGRALYDLLRQVDEYHCTVALTSLPTEEGLGAAISDRLRRAAGPRE